MRPWQRLAIIGIISCAYVIWNISVLNIKGKINKIAIILFSRTIHKFLKRIWERGNIENFPRSRGRRQMTPRDDRILFRSVKTNRRQTLKDVKARFNQRTSCNVSSRTVCRRLFRGGYKRRVVSKKITISQINRQRRVAFCLRKLHWRVDQWSHILFSDETKIILGQNR